MGGYYDEHKDEIVLCESAARRGKPLIKDWGKVLEMSGLFPELESETAEDD